MKSSLALFVERQKIKKGLNSEQYAIMYVGILLQIGTYFLFIKSNYWYLPTLATAMHNTKNFATQYQHIFIFVISFAIHNHCIKSPSFCIPSTFCSYFNERLSHEIYFHYQKF